MLSPIDVMVVGNVIEVKDEHPLNACSPSDVRVDGSVIEVRDEHL